MNNEEGKGKSQNHHTKKREREKERIEKRKKNSAEQKQVKQRHHSCGGAHSSKPCPRMGFATTDLNCVSG